MKIILFSAFLCLAGLAHGANIERLSRNTEAIIPSIVEEILKAEVQSDLKKNSVEIIEAVEPVVKTIKEEVIVEPVASRTVEDGALPVEEKKPEIVELVAVKEIIPEIVPAVRTVEDVVPEIIEKVEVIAVENIEKPIDNFRTESVPAVEIIKETVVVEPVSELRKEPVIDVIVKEEEITKPMLRNVIKEEIPQIEELRNEMVAIKDVIPEPVVSSNIVEPVVEIVQQVKTLPIEPVKEIKEEIIVVPVVKAVPEIVKPEVPEIVKVEVPVMKVDEVILKSVPQEVVVMEIKEEKLEVPSPVLPVVKTIPEFKPVPEMIMPEMPVEAVVPVVDEVDPLARQDRPTIVQQVQDVIANVPIVGQIFNRNPATVAADEAVVADESITTTARPNVLQFAQQAIQNTQQFAQQAVNNVFGGLNNNAVADTADSTTTRPGPLAAAVQFVQAAAQNAYGVAQNIVNPSRATTTTTSTAATPAEEEDKPVKEEAEAAKSEPQIAVEPVVVQKEVAEPQKVVEEEKENLVKNWNRRRNEKNMKKVQFLSRFSF